MAGNKGSGRPNTINIHPEKKTIIKQIVLGEHGMPGGMSKAAVARRIGLSPETITRYRKDHITEEMVRAILADARIEKVEADTEILNDERMDVARTYESLARRVERLITKAEDNEDDGFALAAMEGLRKVLRDIATMHGKMATDLSVSVTLSESPEWVTLKQIIRDVCDEVPEAREPFLRRMRHHVLSVSQESGDAI
ncbi:helix-turn-helix domain-containing protein [Ruegeria sp. HKCCA4008]|uniref:helix-turn-helix domain-containing protein n=1 Tax=Ruegeria sp. HKCCA4008 TaxID=2682999 RepID=UPI001489ED79|nr:helix-turn-helix domain-containing protein [Ruegeria sp. HKCCA4008]